MTTTEANRLSDEFAARAAKARALGNKVAAAIWNEAAADVLKAEGDSLTTSFNRSRKRQAKKDARRMAESVKIQL